MTKVHDGLQLLVRFYDNHGSLNQVAEKSGVPLKALREWLDGGALSDEHRKILTDIAFPEGSKAREKML